MRIILLLMCIAGITNTCNAQNNKNNKEFDSFRKEINEDFNNFRKEIMSDFIEFVRNPWKESDSKPPVPKPKENPIPPVTIPENDSVPKDDKPIVIDNVIKLEPVLPQPEPIEPIKEVPTIQENYISFEYFGTQCKVRFPNNIIYKVNGMNENAIADALAVLTSDEFDNLMFDCLKIREDLQLCDWAYLLFLNDMSQASCGKETNEATLLMSYVYLQSGYKMRLAHDGQHLYMLYSSKHSIFEKSCFNIDGDDFYGVTELPSRLMVSNANFPKEKSLSLIIPQQPLLTIAISPKRRIASSRYSSFVLTPEVNKNLLSFYETYPSSYYNGDFMTQWAQYANTPIAPNVAESLYPEIRKMLNGLSEKDAVNKLLNWVQTGFEYEFDDKIWGHDRTFFAEESLYYPYCDCEDRSVLLSRIIRDVLKLKCLLIYYPGHLATAVKFNEDVNGDYISVDGNKYIVCDPTYIGAPVGVTMPEMKNSKAGVILLK